MEIYKLQLHSTTNAEHITLMEFTATATEKYPYIAETFPKPVEVFTEAYDNENEAYLKSTRSMLTKQIQAANDTRILRFRSLNAMLYAASTCAEAAKKEAGEFLMAVVRDYGGESKIVRMRVNAMSGVLTNLVEDFQGRFAEKTAAAGATECVEELRVANEAYKSLRSERTEETSEIAKQALRDARSASDSEWRNLVDSVNLRYHYEKDSLLVPFMKYMNTEIDTYRIQLGQGVGGSTSAGGSSSSGSGSDSSGGEVAAIMKNATFKFIGGRTEIIPVEVGTVLIPPTNTEGYKWKPTVPELMPKTNKTFSEVPIEDREVTLTFHFLEHNDETLRGIVGSELTAPQNTDGCHWEPTVPPTFPEEDMTFNEVLDEPAGGSGDYSVAKFIFQSGESEEIRQLVGSVLHAPQNTEGCQWVPAVPATMPAVNTTYNEVGEGEKLYMICWYDKSTPVAWYELPEGAAVPEAPEPPAGCRWAQTFTVMPARDVDIIAVAL